MKLITILEVDHSIHVYSIISILGLYIIASRKSGIYTTVYIEVFRFVGWLTSSTSLGELTKVEGLYSCHASHYSSP